MDMDSIVLTCIGCPMGCMLTVNTQGGEAVDVVGHHCGRGKKYAQEEVSSPKRTLTTIVPVVGASRKTVAVKTSDSVPKDAMFDCVRALRNVTLQAPIHMGDVLVENLAGTGVSLVAASTIL